MSGGVHQSKTRGRGGWLRRNLWLLMKVFVVMLLVFGFTYVGTRFDLLPEVERTASDIQMRSNPPREDTHAVIVRITDRDYRDYFNATSPLDSAALLRVIGAIAKTQPRVIAVDVDTEAASYASLEIPPDWPPVVWARVARREPSGKLRPAGVLGGRPAPCSGIVTLKAEGDRVARRYQRMFFEDEMADPRLCEQAGEGEGDGAYAGGEELCRRERCPFPSFAWAVVNAYDPARFGGKRRQSDLSAALAIEFAGNPDAVAEEGREPEPGHDLTVRDVFDGTDGSQPAALRDRFKGILKDKIVLLGGGYASARDMHATPLGLMTGVRINAQAVETELGGGGLPPPNRAVIVLLLLAENVFIVLYFQSARYKKLFEPFGLVRYRKRVLFLLSPLLVVALSLVCSFLAFHSARNWIFFMPTLLILVALEAYDRMKEYRNELLSELGEGHDEGHDKGHGAEDGAGRAAGGARRERYSFDSFDGTLVEYVPRKVAELSAEYEREGRAAPEVLRTPVSTSLKAEAYSVEIRSRSNGRTDTRRLFFFEDSDGRKVSVADDHSD